MGLSYHAVLGGDILVHLHTSLPFLCLACSLRSASTKAFPLAAVDLGLRLYSLLLFFPSCKFPLST